MRCIHPFSLHLVVGLVTTTTVVRPQSSPQLFLAAQSLLISFFTRPRRSPTRPACQLPLWATFRGDPCEKDRRRRDRTWEAHVWTGRNDNYLLLLQQTYMQCIEVESRDPEQCILCGIASHRRNDSECLRTNM